MNKNALITGASSGIGRHAAIRIAERGARVIVTYNGNLDGAEETVATIVQAGGDAVAMRLDLARSDTFAAFAEEVGPLDYLVNNAGVGGPSPFAETTDEVYEAYHRVLLKGPYFLTQAVLPRLADGGAIVNVTSGSALPTTAEPGYAAYAAMKGGLAVFTRYLAKELGPRRIRVNAVAPGPTRTRLGGDAFEHHPEVIPPLVERTALGRLGEGDDVGKVIAVLLSDECAWITGEQIEVSGGYLL